MICWRCMVPGSRWYCRINAVRLQNTIARSSFHIFLQDFFKLWLPEERNHAEAIKNNAMPIFPGIYLNKERITFLNELSCPRKSKLLWLTIWWATIRYMAMIRSNSIPDWRTVLPDLISVRTPLPPLPTGANALDPRCDTLSLVIWTISNLKGIALPSRQRALFYWTRRTVQ